jgi:hypothetical protein
VKGNPEFKLFIQELGEANSLEDLEQSPAILTFRAARYSHGFRRQIAWKTVSEPLPLLTLIILNL